MGDLRDMQKAAKKRRIIYLILVFIFTVLSMIISLIGKFIEIVILIGLVFGAVYFCTWLIGFDLIAILSKFM